MITVIGEALVDIIVDARGEVTSVVGGGPLNTARSVLRDVETRRQIHIIQDELGKLGKDFGRFDERMRRLAEHIRQAHEDAGQVQISSRKISERFAAIERAELPEGARSGLRQPGAPEGETPPAP